MPVDSSEQCKFLHLNNEAFAITPYTNGGFALLCMNMQATS